MGAVMTKSIWAIMAFMIGWGACFGQMSTEEAQRILGDKKEKASKVEPHVARNPPGIAESINNLRPSDQSLIREFAGHCVIINRHLWSRETLSDRDRTLRKLTIKFDESAYDFVDPYTLHNAPNYVRLSDGATAMDESAAIKVELSEEISAIPGAIVLVGTVQQVVHNGIIVDASGMGLNDVFVKSPPGTYAEDELMILIAKESGLFSYLTVLGASRTIRQYEVVDIPADLSVKQASGEDIFAHLVENDLHQISIYRPTCKVDKSPSYETHKHSVGPGMSRTTKKLSQRGSYHWEWNKIDRPVNLYDMSKQAK